MSPKYSISREVRDSAIKLIGWWQEASEDIALLQLDGTWPSIGVLDLLTNFLREGEVVGEKADFLDSAAAYAAGVIADAWSPLASEVLITHRDGASLTIGAQLKDSEAVIEVDLFNSLKHVLQPSLVFDGKVPSVDGCVRKPTHEDNILCPVMLGLTLARSPLIHFSETRDAQSWVMEHSEEVVRVLARQTSAYYKRVFPDEKVGQVSELYLRSLVYPPLGMEDDYLGETAISDCIEFAGEFELGRDSILRFAYNLSLTADELLSSVGLVIYTALSHGDLPPQVLTAAANKGRNLYLLRSGIQEVRGKLLGVSDWSDDLSLNDDDAWHGFQREQRAGFMPRLAITREQFADRDVRGVLHLIAKLDLPKAVKKLSHLIGRQPHNYTLRINRALLFLFMGDIERAKGEIDGMSKIGEVNSTSLYHGLLRDYFSLTRRFGDAETHARKALKSGTRAVLDDSVRDNELRLAAILAALKRYKECQSVALSGDPNGETFLGSYFHYWSAIQLGKREKPREVFKRYPAFTPSSRDVFRLVFTS